MSLLYAYLVSTRKIPLPSGTDRMYDVDSHEIDVVLNEMFQLMKKEKNFIREVYNTSIEFIQDKEAMAKIQQDEKKQIEAEQNKKIAAAKFAAANVKKIKTN